MAGASAATGIMVTPTTGTARLGPTSLFLLSRGLYGIDSVSMLSPTDVWAVGTNNTIFHWDGNAWTLQANPADVPPLYSIDAVSATDVWTTGDAGQILHWDGAAWSLPSDAILRTA